MLLTIVLDAFRDKSFKTVLFVLKKIKRKIKKIHVSLFDLVFHPACKIQN